MMEARRHSRPLHFGGMRNDEGQNHGRAVRRQVLEYLGGISEVEWMGFCDENFVLDTVQNPR